HQKSEKEEEKKEDDDVGEVRSRRCRQTVMVAVATVEGKIMANRNIHQATLSHDHDKE
ncbi:hypothetical protein PIB30_056916, partial [Stylosanthes scabra]|nr:hypothetical protein [Stylosanthes scabra]